ncbi:hypothetical protein [Paracoccus laeviglucosivorans]|uniref:Uncharacterized protein n=1 Tax=Paracoccus laeviglucosivorans TaxID=1197861 RepID=A0A521DQV6_9RHOB|nr:hypothetical protein [Paracoccus laeviglucosivorans]SMO74107.1 hypothetical protein SAMN06265221_10958 [Paracoccus laeviglucosivorans]
MAKGWTTIAIGIVAALAVVLGLVLTGGPGHARKQKRDMQREQDLISMSSWIDCIAQSRNALPQTPEPTDQCAWDQRAAGPYTQAPYRYQAISPRSYRICADFELPPQRPIDRWGRDAEGCITREFLPRG